MKKRITLLVLVAFVICNVLGGELFGFGNQIKNKTFATGSTNKDIYLLIGQSNMAGRAAIGKYTYSLPSTVKLFDSKNQWVAAKNALNRYNTFAAEPVSTQGVGPGFSFAEALNKELNINQKRNINIGLVVNAKGGSSIGQWAKTAKPVAGNSLNYYNQVLKRAKAALVTGNLKGILWLQGEANRSTTPVGYGTALNKLIDDLRADLSSPNAKFYASEIYDGNKYTKGKFDSQGKFVLDLTTKTTNTLSINFNNNSLNSAPLATKKRNGEYFVIDSTGTKTRGSIGITELGVRYDGKGTLDFTHFETSSQILLGQRFAKAVVSSIY